MMSASRSERPRWLYHGSIFHARMDSPANAFRYPGLFLCFPLQARGALKGPLFGLNQPNLFAFYDRDHGDGGDPQIWIRNILRTQGMTWAVGEVWLLTMPRMLGFVFNPVSFWYCHDGNGLLRAVLCEVNNTFGERHCYLLTAPQQASITSETVLTCQKNFHVSPFFAVEGSYHFQFLDTRERRTVRIDYFQAEALTLTACLSGTALPLRTGVLLKTLLKLGWATLLVVIRIHWQALKLWLGGAAFHRKPFPPAEKISLSNIITGGQPDFKRGVP